MRRDGGIYVFRPRISPSPRWRDAARRDWRQNDRFRSFDAERRASRSRDDWRWQAQPRRDAPRLRREEADNWDRGRVLRNGERGGDGGPPRFDRDNPRFDDRFARRNFERVAPPERNRGQANRTERNRDLAGR